MPTSIKTLKEESKKREEYYILKRGILLTQILLLSFGCGFSEGYGNDFDITKLRYDKIVNVGIQQSGIEDSVPEKIRKTSMDSLQLFMDDDDKETVKRKYGHSSWLRLYAIKLIQGNYIITGGATVINLCL